MVKVVNGHAYTYVMSGNSGRSIALCYPVAERAELHALCASLATLRANSVPSEVNALCLLLGGSSSADPVRDDELPPGITPVQVPVGVSLLCAAVDASLRLCRSVAAIVLLDGCSTAVVGDVFHEAVMHAGSAALQKVVDAGTGVKAGVCALPMREVAMLDATIAGSLVQTRASQWHSLAACGGGSAGVLRAFLERSPPRSSLACKELVAVAPLEASRARPAVIRYFVILLRGRPERVANVERMRRLLPNLTVVDAVVGADLGRKELEDLVKSGFLSGTSSCTIIAA